MAVNRIRGAFAAPRKGETFELRAGLVYEHSWTQIMLFITNKPQLSICLRTVSCCAMISELTVILRVL